MYHYFNSIEDDKGNALKGYFVGAFLGGVEQSIYADASSTPIISVSNVANRAMVDNNGNASFYIPFGSYDLQVYAPDAVTPIGPLITDIPMEFGPQGEPGPTGPAGDVAKCDLRTDLQAITGQAANASRWLAESGRQGIFMWSSADNATNVANDPQQGVYVAPASDTTGASGAWVRKDHIITPFHFGAVGDYTTDDLAALQAFNNWFFADTTNTYVADFSGNFAIAGTLTLGPGVVSTFIPRYSIRGSFNVKQIAANTFITVEATAGLNATVWDGSLTVVGNEGQGALFNAKTCGIGIYFSNNSLFRFTGFIRTLGFWYIGVFISDPGAATNDDMSLGCIQTYNCGSGYSLSGWSCTANWSNVVRSGLSRNITQTDTLTVDTLPNAAIETLLTVAQQPLLVNIAGTWYNVNSWNRAAGTITLSEWIDAASFAAGSGTLRYAFGGGLMTRGSDSNILTIDHLQALACGIGYSGGALYGLTISGGQVANCGIGVLCGCGTSQVHMGDNLSLYTESNDNDLVILGVTDNTWNYWNSSFALMVDSIQVIGPRDTSTDTMLYNMGFRVGPDPNLNFFRLAEHGKHHDFHDNPVWNPTGTTVNFNDHTQPPRVWTQTRDSQTIALQAKTSSYNRLWGYRGSYWAYSGSGVNGAPTGSFTFTPTSAVYSCTTTNGSPTVTTASTAGLLVGMPITGTGIPASTTISSITNATTFVLSANATAGATNNLTVTGRINGVFANAVFSGFAREVVFDIHFNDKQQLDWSVIVLTGQMLSGGGAVGYQPSVGVGGAVTQATSKSTAVTLNKITGAITLNNASLAAGAIATFTLNNSQILPDDEITVRVKSGYATAGTYRAWAEGNASGSRTICIQNISAGALGEAVVLGFINLRGASS